MPTHERLQRAREATELVELPVAAPHVDYSPQYLRTLMWRSDNPPPLVKRRGRWCVNIDELKAWAAARDAS
jgi:hypothetical protein